MFIYYREDANKNRTAAKQNTKLLLKKHQQRVDGLRMRHYDVATCRYLAKHACAIYIKRLNGKNAANIHRISLTRTLPNAARPAPIQTAAGNVTNGAAAVCVEFMT